MLGLNVFLLILSKLPADLCLSASPAAIDCVVGSWGPWSSCTSPCGVGSTERSRQVSVPPRNGGTPCPDLKQRRGCFGNNAICSTAKGENLFYVPLHSSINACMHSCSDLYSFGEVILSGGLLSTPWSSSSGLKAYLQLHHFKTSIWLFVIESCRNKSPEDFSLMHGDFLNCGMCLYWSLQWKQANLTQRPSSFPTLHPHICPAEVAKILPDSFKRNFKDPWRRPHMLMKEEKAR